MDRYAVLANSKDNVATAVRDLKTGQEILIENGERELIVKLRDDIPFGHKFAIKEIKKGCDVIKYGEEIGEATMDIKPGEYVHVHNLVSKRGRGDLEVSK
ncbi:UxaA family hydrolase [Thermoanaerobacterium thermosaccharolyticum]|uniref:UxaA family hydrolase n=1 Tax=Thermoanaerobacterium thermosaccharolyticum TaxID=1517 RepID=UPI00177CA944|nr:UxaA family hydrolase [Thermoanaerobacterium thermosaccharolyticum]MBE0069327.1 UxaA family hydrolase [Thermoanaerobacterium thermosaccharolyticum]MBE0229107.1 UxaA family hydrolase [Thermoanaerobacterium thermosaccharolyticum]